MVRVQNSPEVRSISTIRPEEACARCIGPLRSSVCSGPAWAARVAELGSDPRPDRGRGPGPAVSPADSCDEAVGPVGPTAPSGTIRAVMAKYDPLRDYLSGLPRAQSRASMSFARVEELLGEPLPPSARAYDDWWRGRARWRKVVE